MSRLRGPALLLGMLPWSLPWLFGCEPPLGEPECDQLLDHYTERLLREEQPDISNVELSRKQQAARSLAKDAPRFEYKRCTELVSRGQFECAMTAPNVDGIERCLM